MKIVNLVILIFLILPAFVFALEDGTHDAVVTTDSGSYTVPVEVDGDEVTHVYWPNGGAMTVYGGEIDGGEADGTNSKGDLIHIEIDDD